MPYQDEPLDSASMRETREAVEVIEDADEDDLTPTVLEA